MSPGKCIGGFKAKRVAGKKTLITFVDGKSRYKAAPEVVCASRQTPPASFWLSQGSFGWFNTQSAGAGTSKHPSGDWRSPPVLVLYKHSMGGKSFSTRAGKLISVTGKRPCFTYWEPNPPGWGVTKGRVRAETHPEGWIWEQRWFNCTVWVSGESQWYQCLELCSVLSAPSSHSQDKRLHSLNAHLLVKVLSS